MRGGLPGALTVVVCLAGARPAAAEVTLMEKDDWSFFSDGRVNAFFSQGMGDDFPEPTPNTNVGADGNPGPQHGVVGSGQPFTAGYSSDQGTPDGKYGSMRVRSGFLGSILAFGI